MSPKDYKSETFCNLCFEHNKQTHLQLLKVTVNGDDLQFPRKWNKAGIFHFNLSCNLRPFFLKTLAFHVELSLNHWFHVFGYKGAGCLGSEHKLQNVYDFRSLRWLFAHFWRRHFWLAWPWKNCKYLCNSRPEVCKKTLNGT